MGKGLAMSDGNQVVLVIVTDVEGRSDGCVVNVPGASSRNSGGYDELAAIT